MSPKKEMEERQQRTLVCMKLHEALPFKADDVICRCNFSEMKHFLLLLPCDPSHPWKVMGDAGKVTRETAIFSN